MAADAPTRALIESDCLEAMRQLPDGSVDLIYADPPFGIGRKFAAPDKSAASAEYEARGAEFEDGNWAALACKVADWQTRKRAVYRVLVAVCTEAERGYLHYMALRLMECRRLLARDGAIYLHCAPRASAGLKLLLDAVFGACNYRNQIVWDYGPRPSAPTTKVWPRQHDIILYNSRTGAAKYRAQRHAEVSDCKRDKIKNGYNTLSRNGVNSIYIYDERKVQHLVNTHKLDLRKFEKVYHGDPGLPAPLADVQQVNSIRWPWAEYTGFPTQKPIELLRRIIRAGTDPGGTVLDPFCGSGTTCVAAEVEGRSWIGIDRSAEAIRVAAKRVRDTAGIDGGGLLPGTILIDRPRRAITDDG